MRIGEVLWEKTGVNEKWEELKTNIDLAIIGCTTLLPSISNRWL